MDKNQATGLLLISALLIGYLYFFGNNEVPAEETQTTEQVQEEPRKEAAVEETIEAVNDSLPADTIEIPYDLAPAKRGKRTIAGSATGQKTPAG